jgi:putative FmdB family regulatory protein
MPTFDFRCRKCGHLFEESIPFGSKKLPPCPDCKAKQAEKLLTPPMGIHFKGSGFYKTDSAPKAAPEKPAKDTKTDSAPKSTPSSDKGPV